MVKHQIDADLRDKLVKYFSAIEELADELTTANVSHKKSYIKGFAGRAKEYLIKHTLDMAVSDRLKLTSLLSVLREVAANYQGKTIDNTIQQMEARLGEVIKQETI